MKKFKIGVTDILLLVFSILFFLGILTVFKSCGPKDDGSWMTCHWAGNIVLSLSVVLTVISIIHIIISNPKIKLGLSIAILPIAVLAILVPGNLIPLCMMATMRCRAIMQPAAIVISILIIITAIFDTFIQRKK